MRREGTEYLGADRAPLRVLEEARRRSGHVAAGQLHDEEVVVERLLRHVGILEQVDAAGLQVHRDILAVAPERQRQGPALVGDGAELREDRVDDLAG